LIAVVLVFGARPALWIGVGGMVVQALWLHLSKFRHARLSAADTGVTT
jgi:hypothetical protein